ncbi:MAG: Gfo/Idh/MocA family oxidoreductase, partial [Euryarchaeota archaeon]|nr:Gfo/Idh/MocA family oxidoreductase [Euryarchaeota archaeon]
MGVKVGIIGCGRWGTVHLNTLNSLKKMGTVSEIHACDLIPSKEVDLTGLIDSFCANWQTMVESVELDIIAIVTPVETHCELALQVIDYCKVLFIEKPIGLTQLEASAIISKVEERGGNLLVGHILRFHDLINQANNLISKGTIGELQRVDFSRITTRAPPKNPNVFDALAIHGIDTACYCFGEIEPVGASIDNLSFNNKNQPIHARISLEFPGAKEASIDVGWNGDLEAREIVFSGSEGKMIVEMKNSNSIKLLTKEHDKSIVIENTQLPLKREWEYVIETLN